jgi:hypothetical protein
MITGEADTVENPSLIFILMGLGSNIAPSCVAFIVSHQSMGKSGVEQLKMQFSKKNSLKMYGFTGIIVPLGSILTILISHFTLRAYQINIIFPMIIMGLIWPLFSGFGEEFGWRGYILPQLLKNKSPIKAAVYLGIIWEVWHIPMHYMAYKNFGIYMIPAFIFIGFINLTLHTVIMTVIYIKSQSGLKLMILYHYTITACAIIIGGVFSTISTPQLIVFESIISAAIFCVITLCIVLKFQKSTR